MTQEEFKIKVFPLKNKLFRFAKRLLENTEEAEDMVQEAFIKLWNMKEKLSNYRSVEALAMVTTRNLCLDRLRAKKYTIEKIDTLKDEVNDVMIEQKNDHSEIISRIHQIIKTLPEQQRTIIHLRDIEGYDYEEIAAILDMNENAVRVNVSRARKKIREMITQQHIYEYQRN
jgi:RNA polymerase sigma-70 factor (ECF subfamily)